MEWLVSHGWGEAEFAQQAERRKGITSAFVNHDDEAWVVEWVACLPEHRGNGYMNKLLLAILERGRQKGYKTVRSAYLLHFADVMRLRLW